MSADARETVEKLRKAQHEIYEVCSGKAYDAVSDALALLTAQERELKMYRDALDSEAILEQQRYKANYERVAKQVLAQADELATLRAENEQLRKALWTAL